MKNIAFLITSTINFPNTPLSYSQTRSIYTPEERIDQLIDTVNSVRRFVPFAYIIILESSCLNFAQQNKIKKKTDLLYSFCNDRRAQKLTSGPHKGAGELYMLYSALKNGIADGFDFVFKLSGRYCLNNKFRLEKFLCDRYVFKICNREKNFSTRLYSVPSLLLNNFIKKLRLALFLSRFGISIEHIFYYLFDREHVKNMNELGVNGRIAVNGTPINE